MVPFDIVDPKDHAHASAAHGAPRSSGDARFHHDEYIVRRRIMVLLGSAVDILTPDGAPVLFGRGKAFVLREDLRIYADESRSQELLTIKARHIIDFAPTFDVTDATTGEHIGSLRRQGFRSMLRDRWDILDHAGIPIGAVEEDSWAKALLRRFLTALVPQEFHILNAQGELLAVGRQFFNPFMYKLRLSFQDRGARQPIDRRLLLALALLLATIEGRQED